MAKEKSMTEIAYGFYQRIARIARQPRERYSKHPRAEYNYYGWLNTYADLENTQSHEKWSDVRAAAARSVMDKVSE